MIQALHTGASGLLSNQMRMDIIANNFANVNTTGYKSVRADFKDTLYETMKRPVASEDDLNLELGHGVLVASTTRVISQGALLQSGRKTDVAINGTGFFSVRDADGNTLYTRDGNFHASVEDDGTYLVTQDGKYLLDVDGREIVLPEDPTNFVIGSDGWVSEIVTNSIVELDENALDDFRTPGMPYAQIGVYKFPNEEGLQAVGGNFFAVTENSGGAALKEGAEIRQGYLEGSTTDMANEMTQMILAQRAYQLASRVVTTADEMEGVANNLRK